MKRINILLSFFIVAAFVFSGDAFARRGPGRGRMMNNYGWGPGSSYMRMYNPSTIETIKGKVVKVDKITPMKGMYYGIHALIKTGEEELSVHLGPGWYVEKQTPQVKEGDQVEITGSKITFQGKPALIAAKLTKGDETLVLRDENGFPKWRGWRRGGMMMQPPANADTGKKTN